jgi:hypothetical protein
MSGCAPDASSSDRTQDRSALDAIGGPNFTNREMSGGSDLQYADASVLLQESTILKAEFAGAPVGEEDFGAGPFTLPGIQPGLDDLIEPMPWTLDPDALAKGIVLYEVANQYEKDPRCDSQARDENGDPIHDPSDPGLGFGDPNDPGSDFGFCVSQNRFWYNPATDTVDFQPVLNDPTDASNSGNGFGGGGENCTAFVLTNSPLGGSDLDAGCTQLERYSANYERAWIALETVGVDGFHDPIETMAEWHAITNGDPSDDGTGDPVAGPDGIFVRNRRVFRTDEVDFQVLQYPATQATQLIRILQPETAAGDPIAVDDSGHIGTQLGETAEEFFARFAPNGGAGGDCAPVPDTRECYLKVGEATEIGVISPRELVMALPIAFHATVRGSTVNNPDTGQPYFENGDRALVNLAWLEATDLVKFAELLSGVQVTLPLLWRNLAGNIVQVDAKLRLTSSTNSQSELSKFFLQDLDTKAGDQFSVLDFDQDQDGRYDGLDDYTPGPVSDDATSCGSGIPGDTLQEGIQVEMMSDAEQALLEAEFPDGFPPRSPVFCGTLQRLLGHTVADGSGRLRFRWHVEDAGIDADVDGVPDDADNCVAIANASQLDVDDDGFGNACDCDFNADGLCDEADNDVLQTCFGLTTGPAVGPADDPSCEESDMNGDGIVAQPDYSLFLARFGGEPGPAATGASGVSYEAQAQGNSEKVDPKKKLRGELGPGTDRASYTVEGRAGHRLKVRVKAKHRRGEPRLRVAVFGPGDTLLAEGDSRRALKLRLPESGLYRVVLSLEEAPRRTPYRLRVKLKRR